MKIKLLSLILILMGVIVISGCVDSQAQPSTYKAPGDLYRSIFSPYAGLLNKGNEVPGVDIGPHGPPPGMPDESQGSARSLRDAALMLDNNIEKAEAISARLESGVQYLREQGKDVSRLEALLEEYNSLVEEARNYRALAASSSGEENSSPEGNKNSEDGSPVESAEKEYLIKSQKSMIRANLVLKDIFDEFKRLMPGSGELNETARLSAKGEGRVTLIGGFNLNLHLQEGEIVIMEISPDSTVYVKGNYTLEIKEGRQENVLVYHIQSADVEISGSHKMLLLNGENITVEAADGEGYATFFGNGTYSIEDTGGIKKEEKWAVNSFFEEQMGPEEPGKTENRITVVGTHGPETGIRETLLKRISFIKENL
ncbi:MAG: hypothetical protein AB9861_00235 [Methanosarcina sp.]|jgi:hypothetical protein